MKILILGASSKKSIGYLVGEQLRKMSNHDVVYASRRGKLGFACDITSHRDLALLLKKINPIVIIHAAGVFAPPALIGSIRAWDQIRQHLSARGFGALMMFNAAAARGVRYVITIGGRKLSSDPMFAMYTAGNGILWALVQFAAQHTRIRSYYIDIPFIRGSAMETKYLLWKNNKEIKKNISIEANVVSGAVERILDDKHKSGSRIILGKKGGQ